MEIHKRYRVNISTSTKGVVTPDQTVEITAVYEHNETELDLQGMILQESDELHTALVARYPTEVIK